MMKYYKFQLVILNIVFFILVLPKLAQAQGIFEDKDIYWSQGPNIYFKYEKNPDSEFGKNEHPVKLDSKDISVSLESLKIWEKSTLTTDEELIPVFTLSQTKQIGKLLSKGLKTAKPEQDILFVVDKKTNRLLGLKTDQFYVAGRAFYKEGKLNILIGDYDRPRLEGYEAAYDPTHTGIVRYFFDHGSRTRTASGFDKSIFKVDGVENNRVNNKIRKDWFVIDVKLAAESFIAQKKAEQNPGSTVMSEQMQAEAAKLAKERREMRLEMARLRKEMKENNNGQSSLTIEERLKKLSELRDGGLVSEEEYNSKREEILNDI